MKTILLILPYFGKWPIWIDAHLRSIEKNPTINWLFVTDCEIPQDYPNNIKFVTTTLQELNERVNHVVGVDVPLTPRKFCDIRLAFGEIFKDFLENYDFWGFCDADVIWGDIRKFITDDILSNNDIISSRKDTLSGHFSLFRNISKLNVLYKNIPDYKELFGNAKLMRMDEECLTDFLKENTTDYGLKNRIYWPTILLNQERGIDSHQEYHLDKWQWKDGKILGLENGKYTNEVMYLHFINWKKTMKKSEVKYTHLTDYFYISYSSIHFQLHSNFEKNMAMFTNLFNGYYAKEYRRIKKKKFQKKLERIIKKIKK